MKYHTHIKQTLFISLMVLSITTLTAQNLYFDLRNSAGVADYLMGSRLVENASYTSTAFSLSSILSDNSRAYLDISHSQIIPYSEYSSSQGELGLQLRYLEVKDNQLYAGLYAYLNNYDETYSYYNSSGFGLYGKWKHYFKASQLTTFGYDLNFKKFEEVAEASNTEHEFYAIYNQSFKTKTSVNWHAALAVQDFWSQTTLSGRGRYISTVAVDDIPSNALASTELRLSQSLGPKLGLTVWLGAQSLLNDEADSLSLQDGLENPFTDRFRWEGPSSSVRVLYRLNSNNSFKMTHSYVKKSYLDVPVYAFDFQTMDYILINEELVNMGFDREDERNSFRLQWSRNWILTKSAWLSDLDLVLGAGFTNNKSNDALYDYAGMNYNISINFNN